MCKEFEELDPEETEIWSNDGAVCPYCGYINKPHENDNYELYDDMTDEFSCNNCNKRFKVYVNISHDWETKKLEED